MPLTRRIVALGLLIALAGGSLASRADAFQQATTIEPHWHPREDVILIVPQRRLPSPVANAAYLEAADATIDIKDQVATTALQLSLTNPTDSPQQAEILLPIPDGVVVRSLQYDGVGPEPIAKVLPSAEARQIYDDIVRRLRDPALVEFAGTNVIRTSAFPIPPRTTQKLSLTFEQVLAADGSRVDYWLPRSDSMAASGVKWSIHGTISSQSPIASVYSPSHEIETKRGRNNVVSWHVSSAAAADVERGSFRLSYMTTPKGDGLSWSMLAYPDSRVSKDGNGGYFMLMAALPPIKDDGPKIKREVVLVLDRSGSMRGEKMEQVKAAALQVVEGLDEGEAFNIIDYSDSINSFASEAVVKSKETMDAVRDYIKSIQAGGGTNIQDSLTEALRQKPTKDMLPIVLFLTDGLPTVGERSEVKIREAIKQANKYQRRIFSFGVGYDVNSPLLSNIAKNSRALPTFVMPKEDVEVKVSQVFKRLSGPVLALPKLTVPCSSPGPASCWPSPRLPPSSGPRRIWLSAAVDSCPPSPTSSARRSRPSSCTPRCWPTAWSPRAKHASTTTQRSSARPPASRASSRTCSSSPGSRERNAQDPPPPPAAPCARASCSNASPSRSANAPSRRG